MSFDKSTECAECGQVFEVPSPPTDTIYVPRCPQCDAVAEGYRYMLDFEERVEEAREACEEIDKQLDEIQQKLLSKCNDIPPGSSIEALEEIAVELERVSEYADIKARETACDEKEKRI